MVYDPNKIIAPLSEFPRISPDLLQLLPSDARKDYTELQTMKAENSEAYNELAGRVFVAIRDMLEASGATYFDDINKLYKIIQHGDFIVRRDEMEPLVRLVGKKESIAIKLNPQGTQHSEKYANCCEYNPQIDHDAKAIKTAFLQGRSNIGGIATVYGFKKNDKLIVSEIASETRERLGISDSSVKSVEGEIAPDDLKFVVMKIPATVFPEAEMTDEEADAFYEYLEQLKKSSSSITKPPVTQIFRGFII